MGTHMKEMFTSLLVEAILCGAASAATLTYTEQAPASGSLGSQPFSDALVTLTLTGDTNSVQQLLPGVYVLINTTFLSVSGVGSAVFTDEVQVVANQGQSSAGFGDVSTNNAIFFTKNSAFHTYDLQSAIAPDLGPSVFNSGLSFDTTAGMLVLDGVGFATFAAAASTVPEPATKLPILVSLVGLGACVLNRRKSGV